MRSFGAVIMLCLWATACSEVINLETEPGESQLLIYGRVTDGLEGSIIEIARTSELNIGQEPVEGATITLIHEGGTTEQYVPVEPGIYELQNTTIVGEPGEVYHVSIRLPNGEQYESVPAQMPEKAGEDMLDYEAKAKNVPLENGIMVRRNVVELYSTTNIFNVEDDSYLRWNVVETYLFPERQRVVLDPPPNPPPQWCYLSYELDGQNIQLYDGSTLKTPQIPRRLIATRPIDNAFSTEYYFEVVQSSLTADAYRYWNELDQVANVQGSIFDRPLAPVKSNLFNVNNPDEQVLGYFEVVQADTIRQRIDADDLREFNVRSSCPVVGLVGDECFDCLLLPNSQKVKPHFIDN